MNVYVITKHHPCWAQYQDYFDMNFISRGLKSTSEQRKALQKTCVEEFMKDNLLDEARLEAILRKRKAEGIVHPLYGTD